MKLPQHVNVLLLGSGGREFSFARSLSQSSRLSKLYIAPGNGGTRQFGENVNLKPTDFAAIKTFVLNHHIDLVVVGPEDPLVKGIFDFFAEDPEISHISLIGPSKRGAELEGSKKRAKAFLFDNAIPTARYEAFTLDRIEAGYAFLETLTPPYVLKADGLAAGKGVIISSCIEEAKKELQTLLEGKFGAASQSVVIEEYLHGIELSVFVLTDGEHYKILPEAKDYKRIGEGDTGLNTGGMGAVSPVPFADKSFMDKVETRVIRPTIEGLKKEGTPYCGFVFIGLMNVAGDPYVIEYNVRMGDPETEAVLPRIKSDLIELFDAAVSGRLNEVPFEISDQTAVTVMSVSKGYPEDYQKGFEITGIETVAGSEVFHCGTAIENGKLVTAGGRVLTVTSLAASLPEALEKSYENIARIRFDGMYYRKDIGKDLMQYL